MYISFYPTKAILVRLTSEKKLIRMAILAEKSPIFKPCNICYNQFLLVNVKALDYIHPLLFTLELSQSKTFDDDKMFFNLFSNLADNIISRFKFMWKIGRFPEDWC